jgi:hypothetical protein
VREGGIPGESGGGGLYSKAAAAAAAQGGLECAVETPRGGRPVPLSLPTRPVEPVAGSGAAAAPAARFGGGGLQLPGLRPPAEDPPPAPLAPRVGLALPSLGGAVAGAATAVEAGARRGGPDGGGGAGVAAAAVAAQPGSPSSESTASGGGGGGGRLFEVGTWEELENFDSDDLWSSKVPLFSPPPTTTTTYPVYTHERSDQCSISVRKNMRGTSRDRRLAVRHAPSAPSSSTHRLSQVVRTD